MSSAGLTATAMEETYSELMNLVFDTSHKFVRRYGGEIQETISEANEHYMAAYHSYKPEKGSFSNWVRFRVWNGLMETVRKRLMRQSRCAQVEVDLDFGVDPSPFRLFELMDELSDESKQVVDIIINTPGVVFREEGGDSPNLRDVLRSYLRKLGWSAIQITESFQEIVAVLREFP